MIFFTAPWKSPLFLIYFIREFFFPSMRVNRVSLVLSYASTTFFTVIITRRKTFFRSVLIKIKFPVSEIYTLYTFLHNCITIRRVSIETSKVQKIFELTLVHPPRIFSTTNSRMKESVERKVSRIIPESFSFSNTRIEPGRLHSVLQWNISLAFSIG